MKLNFRVEQKFDWHEPIKPSDLATFFQGVTKQLDVLLGTKKHGMNKDIQEIRLFNIKYSLEV